jgi:hypothetical protein
VFQMWLWERILGLSFKAQYLGVGEINFQKLWLNCFTAVGWTTSLWVTSDGSGKKCFPTFRNIFWLGVVFFFF